MSPSGMAFWNGFQAVRLTGQQRVPLPFSCEKNYVPMKLFFDATNFF
jgi:hypothetical protein